MSFINIAEIMRLGTMRLFVQQNISVATKNLPALQEMYERDVERKEAAVLKALEDLRLTYKRIQGLAAEAEEEQQLNDLLENSGIK